MTARKKKGEGAATAAPEAGINIHVSGEEYAEGVRSNRAWATRVADRIEAGELLSSLDKKMVAGVVRLWAKQLRELPPKPRGQPPRFCHGSWALVYLTYRAQGMSPSAAYAEIADQVGVSEQAVEKKMRDHAPGAARLLAETFELPGIPPNLFKD